VKLGEIQSRLDVNYNLPEYQFLERELRSKFNNIKTISDYSDVVCGPFGSSITDKDYCDEGVPLLRITNITREGKLDFVDLKYISEELSNKLSSTQVFNGDIVISQRGTLGQCAIVDDAFNVYNISANLIAVKNIKNMSAKYIRNYVLSSIGIKFLERAQSGQVQGKITTTDISSMPIPKIENEELLNSIMEKGFLTYQNKITQAEELLKGMDLYVLSTLGLEIPDYTQRLCNAVKLRTVKTDNTLNADFYHPERIGIIRMMEQNTHIKTKRLVDTVDFCRDIVSANNENLRYIGLASVQSHTGELLNIEEEASGQAFAFLKNDVLYGRLRPYLNKVFVAEENGVCSTEFHVMRMKTEDILPNYLSVIMRTLIILGQTRHMMTGNTHPRIANAEVENLHIPIPSKEIQQQIADEAIRRRTIARKLKEEAEIDWKTAKEQFEKELFGGDK
jgi:restriction endonuclease S subunit